jgi:hypothetical protein
MTTSAVGALDLPLASAGAGVALTDPVVELLLAFSGHVLTADIDPRLADLAGTATASCPAAKRFPYAWNEPRGHEVSFPRPSLFCWWDGQSTVVPWSQLYSFRHRQLHLLYCFPELPGRLALEKRTGLMNAIDASLTRWFRMQRHPTFQHNGITGGLIARTVAAPDHAGDRLHIDWLGGRGLPRIGVGETNQGRAGRKTSGQDFPGYAALFEVKERIDWLDASVENAGGTAALHHDESEQLLERYFLPPEPDADLSDEGLGG